MKIRVNSNQLERIVVRWLNLYYGDLRPKEFDDYPDEMFYVNSDDEIMMSHLKIKSGKHIYIDDLRISTSTDFSSFPCLEKQGGGVGHNPSVDLKFKGEFIPL